MVSLYALIKDYKFSLQIKPNYLVTLFMLLFVFKK